MCGSPLGYGFLLYTWATVKWVAAKKGKKKETEKGVRVLNYWTARSPHPTFPLTMEDTFLEMTAETAEGALFLSNRMCAPEVLHCSPAPIPHAKENAAVLVSALVVVSAAIDKGLEEMKVFQRARAGGLHLPVRPETVNTPRDPEGAAKARQSLAGGAAVADRVGVHDVPYCPRVTIVEGSVPLVPELETATSGQPKIAGSLSNGDLVVFYPHSGALVRWSVELRAPPATAVECAPEASPLAFTDRTTVFQVPAREIDFHPAMVSVVNDTAFVITASSVYAVFLGVDPTKAPSGYIRNGMHTAVHALKTDAFASDDVFVLDWAPTHVSLGVLVSSLVSAAAVTAIEDTLVCAANNLRDVYNRPAMLTTHRASLTDRIQARLDTRVLSRIKTTEEAVELVKKRMANLARISAMENDAFGMVPELPEGMEMFLPVNAATKWEHETTPDVVEDKRRKKKPTGDGSGPSWTAETAPEEEDPDPSKPLVRRFKQHRVIQQREAWTHAVAWAPFYLSEASGLVTAAASGLLPKILVSRSDGHVVWIETQGFVQSMTTFGATGLAYGSGTRVWLADVLQLQDTSFLRPRVVVDQVGSPRSMPTPVSGGTALSVFRASMAVLGVSVSDVLEVCSGITTIGNEIMSGNGTKTVRRAGVELHAPKKDADDRVHVDAVGEEPGGDADSGKRHLDVTEHSRRTAFVAQAKLVRDADEEDRDPAFAQLFSRGDDTEETVNLYSDLLGVQPEPIDWLIHKRAGRLRWVLPSAVPLPPLEDIAEAGTGAGAGAGGLKRPLFMINAAFASQDGIVRLELNKGRDSDLETITSLDVVQRAKTAVDARGNVVEGEHLFILTITVLIGNNIYSCNMERRPMWAGEPPGFYMKEGSPNTALHPWSVNIGNAAEVIAHPSDDVWFAITGRRKAVIALKPTEPRAHPAHCPWFQSLFMNEMPPLFESESPPELKSVFIRPRSAFVAGNTVLVIHTGRPMRVTWLVMDDTDPEAPTFYPRASSHSF